MVEKVNKYHDIKYSKKLTSIMKSKIVLQEYKVSIKIDEVL